MGDRKGGLHLGDTRKGGKVKENGVRGRRRTWGRAGLGEQDERVGKKKSKLVWVESRAHNSIRVSAGTE